MATTLTSMGQVTIPKHIRDALNLAPDCSVDFAVNREGEVVIHKGRFRTYFSGVNLIAPDQA
jgi:AbrB family looped-hinge helix DNA binding protein